MTWFWMGMASLTAVIALAACTKATFELNADEFRRKMKEDSTFIIDVRTKAEVNAGYILGTSKFFDYNEPSFPDSIALLNPQNTYLIYCHSGVRSKKAVQVLKDRGFQKVYSLKGGFSAWSDKSVQ